MTKRQKKLLTRIIIAAVIYIAGIFLPLEGIPQLTLYLLCYAVIGWDIVNIASIASFTDLTPVRRIPFGTDPLSFMESRLTWGRMHSSNPSFFASVTRCSAILTARTSPLKPTSPKQIVFSLIGFSR